MKQFLLLLAERLVPGASRLAANARTLASRHGQWRSIRTGSAVDASGAPIPWYTYPSIEYLRAFDFSDCDVFEFGSGNSSLFWAGRARRVTSVEHDAEWLRYVEKTRLANQVLLHGADQTSYVGALAAEGRRFDVIVIDGKWRLECTRSAVEHLKDTGVVLLDNSEREEELACGSLLREHGFFQVDFSGFGPINGYCWTTSLFFRDGLRLQSGFRGPKPIGGLTV